MQESWEGLRGRQAFLKVNNRGERGEKQAQEVREPWGKKAPFYRSPKSDRLSQIRVVRSESGFGSEFWIFGIFRMSTNLIPDRCSTESSCPGIDLFLARNSEPSRMDLFFTRNHPEFQKHTYKKRDISYIRTPFSMFLSSLESPQRALQDHAEKHHSPTWEDKTKCRKVKPF